MIPPRVASEDGDHDGIADILDDGITTAVHIYSPTAVLVYVTIAIAVVTEHPKKPVDVATKRVPA